MSAASREATRILIEDAERAARRPQSPAEPAPSAGPRYDPLDMMPKREHDSSCTTYNHPF